MKKLVFIVGLLSTFISYGQNIHLVGNNSGKRIMSDPNTGGLTTQAELNHQPATWATTTALPTNTYNNGTNGLNATLTATANAALTVDGASLTIGDRVLVKNEVTGANNGIYTVTQVGDGSHPYILTRGSYSAIGTNLSAGSNVFVQGGATNGGKIFYQNTTGTITVGTTVLAYGTQPGSQNLQQTLLNGDSTTLRIISTNDIIGDSANYRNFTFNGNGSVGDTVVFQYKFWNMGNSVDAGYADNNTIGGNDGYGYRVASSYGWNFLNHAITSTTIRQLSAGDSSFQNRLYWMPNFDSSFSYFNVGMAGINDPIGDTTDYKIALIACLDTIHFNRSWPNNRIILGSPYYSPGVAHIGDSVFYYVNREVALMFPGMIFVDYYHPAKTLYLAGLTSISADSLHPSTLGHKIAAQNLYKALPTIWHMKGNLQVYGNMSVVDTLGVNGNFVVGPNGWSTLGTGIYDTTSQNKGLTIRGANLTSIGNWFGITLNPNPRNGNTDSFEIRMMQFGTTGNNEFGIFHDGTGTYAGFYKWYVDHNDNQIWNGTSANAQAGYKYTFAAGGPYFNGGGYVNGAFKIIGDNTIDSLRWLVYKNGNLKGGVGVDASGNTLLLAPSTNGFQFDGVSTSDGKSLTQWGGLTNAGFSSTALSTPGTLTVTGLSTFNGQVLIPGVSSGYSEKMWNVFSSGFNHYGVGLSTSPLFGPGITFDSYAPDNEALTFTMLSHTDGTTKITAESITNNQILINSTFLPNLSLADSVEVTHSNGAKVDTLGKMALAKFALLANANTWASLQTMTTLTTTGAVKLLGTASGSSTDSVLTINSSTGLVTWRAPNNIKYNHTIFTPTTGGTISLVNNQYNIINPTGSLVTLTVNLPSSPANNDVVYIKYTQAITTVTYANGTVVDGITAPTAGGLTVLTYDSATTSWY